MRSLERAFAEQDAVVGEDADGKTVDVSEAANERLAIELLEFLEFGRIHEARDHVANVVERARVRGHDAVELVGWKQRIPSSANLQIGALHLIDIGDDLAVDSESMTFVYRML